MLKRLFTKKEKETVKTYRIKYDDGGDVVDDIITSDKISNYIMGLDQVGAVIIELKEI